MPDDRFVIIVLFFLLYTVAGSLLLSRWRRSRWQRPPALHADPNGWLSSWFPQLIAMELFVWFGAVITALLLVFLSPIMHSVGAQYTLLGFGIGLGGYAIFFVAFDVALVARIRALGRRNRLFAPVDPNSNE